jgi:hypothetical protein
MEIDENLVRTDLSAAERAGTRRNARGSTSASTLGHATERWASAARGKRVDRMATLFRRRGTRPRLQKDRHVGTHRAARGSPRREHTECWPAGWYLTGQAGGTGAPESRGARKAGLGAVGEIEPGLQILTSSLAGGTGMAQPVNPQAPIDRAQKNLTGVARPCSGCHPGPPFFEKMEQ